jgi:hypothetical protein
VSRVQLQRGFVGFVAPLHCGLAAALPGLGQLAGRLERTRAMWERCDPDWDLEQADDDGAAGACDAG